MSRCLNKQLAPSERAHFWHESLFAGKRGQIVQKKWVQKTTPGNRAMVSFKLFK